MNFTALDNRLSRICSSFDASASAGSVGGHGSSVKVMFFAPTCGVIMLAAFVDDAAERHRLDLDT